MSTISSSLNSPANSRKVDVTNPKAFPSYKDTLLAMGITPWEGARLGPQFDREGGDALNKWLREQKLPALTGMVVNQDSSTPAVPISRAFVEAVKLWDFESREELLTLPGRGSILGDAAVSPDGGTLGINSAFGDLNLWRAPSRAEIEEAEKAQATFSRRP